MSVVLDYETQPADFPTMLAHGVVGAVVYIAPQSWGWPKAITPDRWAQAVAAGFLLAPNFEAGTSDYLGGGPKGTQHGQNIYQAMSDLSLPAERACYLSIDTDVGPSNFPLAAAYFAAARTAAGHPLDLYGTTALAEYLAGRGLIKRHWRSASSGFYGNNYRKAGLTVLDQQGGGPVPGLGGSYDTNLIVEADWGQNAPAPVPVPVLTPKDDKLTYFYRVTDNAAVSPNSIWVTDFVWTRHVGSPTALAQDQLWAAFEGAPHVEVHDMPYAFHVDLWQKPETSAAGAPAPSHFTGTVDIKAAT